MRLPKYNFYVGKRVRYMYLTRRTGIDSAGIITSVNQPDKWTSSKLTLSSGEHIVIDLVCATTYSSVFYYDSEQKYIKSVPFVNKAGYVLTPPDNAKYYAVTFAGADISRVYTDGEEVNFIYLAQAIYPHYKELSKKRTKESRQEFFRTTLDGRITLFGNDYERIYSADIEDQFIFLVDRYVPASEDSPWFWEKYFRGEFSKTDCKFDFERKKCELSVSPKDDYTKTLNSYENTYDLIKLAPKISQINAHKRPLMQIYIAGANSISNFFGGTYWESDVIEAVESHNDLVNKYYFAYLKAANEITIEGTGISEIDGVYAGTDGILSNGHGYTCQIKALSGSNIYSTLNIVRDSDNEIVYNSSSIRVISDPFVYISPEVQFSMFGIGNDIVVTPDKVFAYRIYRRLLCDVDSIEDSEGTKPLYDLPLDDFVSDNRNYKKCVGLTGGLVFCTSKTISTATKYGINDRGEYFTNQFLPLSLGMSRPLPICRSTWVNASLWFVYDSYYEVWEPQLRKQYTLKDNYHIADIIQVILSQIDPTLKHEATAEYSQFLYGNTNPVNAAKFYVFLTQKTNILKGEYDQPAQKAETTLAEIMGMLRDCFRCYWFIENGKFKIEHIWFFINGGTYSVNSSVQLDFTNLVDRFNKKPSTYFQSEIEYDKSELSHRYEFNWMDDATELFGNIILDVQSNYVQKDKVEEITANPFSSDVDYMLFNPSVFSNDGFALLCPIKNGGTYELPIVTTTLVDENKQPYKAIAQNWYASWIYLTNQFYKYDMPARLVKCSASVDMVATPKMSMTHSIQFSAQVDVDELKLIKTNVGDGKVEEFSVNLDTLLTKVKLVYRPK